MISLFEDLRFVIGLFFSLLGILLVAVGLGQAPSDGLKLNLLAGGAMLVFAVGMIAFSLLDQRDQAKSKILDKNS